MRHTYLTVALSLGAWSAAGQTAIDLRTQARNVDFSGAASTRPARTGTTLPSSCNTGEMFFKTDEAPGSNLYGCTAAGVWNRLGNGGNALPDPSGQQNRALFSDGVSAAWRDAVRTVTPGSGLITACSDGAGTSSGNCRVYIDDWYAATQTGNNVYSGINDFSGAAALRVKSGSELPAVCNVAETFFKTSAPAGWNWYGCTSQNTWTQLGGGNGGGGAVGSVFGRTGNITAQSGDYTAAQVTNAVDGSASYSNPAWLTSLNWSKITGVPAFAAAAHKTNHAIGGSDALTPADIGAQAAGSYEAPLTFSGPLSRSGNSIACPSCITSSTAADTDVSGTFPHLTVTKIQGRAVSGAAPANLQFLGWNDETNQWEPKDMTGSGTAGTVDWSNVLNRPAAFPPAAHKSAHATGGSDELTPADIGAQAAGSYEAPLTFSGPLSRSVNAVSCPSCITSSTSADTDLSGTFPHLSVTKIQGRAVSSAAPSNAQVLTWSSANSQWEPKDASGGSGVTAVDRSALVLKDDFPAFRADTSPGSELAWTLNAVSGSSGHAVSNVAGTAATIGHPGIKQVATGTTNGYGFKYSLFYSAVDLFRIGTGGDFTGWEANADVLLDNAAGVGALADMAACFGFGATGACGNGAGYRGVAVYADTTDPGWTGCTWNTANFMYVGVADNGSLSCVDSGVAVNSGTWYHLRIWSTAPGTVNFSINGAAQGSVSKVPTSAYLVTPTFQVWTRTSGSKAIWIDYFSFVGTGLGRASQ